MAPSKFGPSIVRKNAWKLLGGEAWLSWQWVSELLQELILKAAKLVAELLSGCIFLFAQLQREIKATEVVVGVLLRISEYQPPKLAEPDGGALLTAKALKRKLA